MKKDDWINRFVDDPEVRGMFKRIGDKLFGIAMEDTPVNTESAFQEAMDKFFRADKYPDRVDCYKGGWNNALEAVLELRRYKITGSGSCELIDNEDEIKNLIVR